MVLSDEKIGEGVGSGTAKRTEFEVPPPGAGLKTVTDVVPGVVTKEGGTVAVSRLWFTN